VQPDPFRNLVSNHRHAPPTPHDATEQERRAVHHRHPRFRRRLGRWLRVCSCVTLHPRRVASCRRSSNGVRIGGEVAKITDRVVVGATHVGRSDRGDRVHVTGPGARGETRDFKADGFDSLAPKLRGRAPDLVTQKAGRVPGRGGDGRPKSAMRASALCTIWRPCRFK